MSRDIVFSGAGSLTAAGEGGRAHVKALVEGAKRKSPEEYELKGYPSAAHLSDRRMLKAVSADDGWALATIEMLKKNAEISVEDCDPRRLGLYVGAPPSSPFDNENYFEAMAASRKAEGCCDEVEFGKSCMNARPTTLLLGLPNNVLCYGAIIMNAKGPNSNYTSAETSGHLAVMNAARRIAFGKIDMAVAGGFSAHTEPVIRSMLAQNAVLKAVGQEETHAIAPGSLGTVVADGAVFFTLETRESAERRGREVLATYVAGATASEAKAHIGMVGERAALGDAIKACLHKGRIGPHEVGLVLTSGMGVPAFDEAELAAIETVFERIPDKPALGTTSPTFGNLMEAGGLLEIAILNDLYELGRLPEAMTLARPRSCGFGPGISQSKPYALIVRGSIFGEWSCLLVRKGGLS